MKTWSGCIAPPFLTWELDGGEWSASRTSRFTPPPPPPRKSPGYPLERIRDGPQSLSKHCGEEKILAPADENCRGNETHFMPNKCYGFPGN
jgi:hypothetical protein